jgi:hypothetical protein
MFTDAEDNNFLSSSPVITMPPTYADVKFYTKPNSKNGLSKTDLTDYGIHMSTGYQLEPLPEENNNLGKAAVKINGYKFYMTYSDFAKLFGYSMDIVEQLLPSAKFDTGGYTGEWGPEGKLAMLH